ncbi:MAG: hypothetical protein ACKVX9_02785 [Blastocatellia bacterium]
MTTEEMLRAISSLPPEGQRLVERFIASLREKYSRAQQIIQPVIGDLQNDNFIGIWRDRGEIKDSSAWVRSLRESEWGG